MRKLATLTAVLLGALVVPASAGAHTHHRAKHHAKAEHECGHRSRAHKTDNGEATEPITPQEEAQEAAEWAQIDKELEGPEGPRLLRESAEAGNAMMEAEGDYSELVTLEPT